MKILIGGGAGYIGSRLIPELIALGHDVDVVDLLCFGNHLGDKVKVSVEDVRLSQREVDFALIEVEEG